MKIRRNSIMALAAAAVMFPAAVQAQSKAETKLYNTALAKQDLKSANKFLAKFPNSTYAPKITRLRDSIVFSNIDPNDVEGYISFVAENPESYFTQAANNKIEQLNTSSITDTQAMEAALAAGFRKESIAAAKGIKSLNKEHVAIILLPAPNSTNYTLVVLQHSNGAWTQIASIEEQIYTNDTALDLFTIENDIKAVTINGSQHLYFGYTNSSNSRDSRSRIANNDCELALNLYSMADNSIYNVLFSGKKDGNILYGSSMDSAQGGIMATPQQTYLVRALAGREDLKPFEQERFHAQELIQWWYKNNPQGAKSISFGIIPDNSPLIELAEKGKDKEKVGNYTVTMLQNVCSNTIVVVRNNESGQYSLAMCQPTPENDNELELNTFYGEKGNILALYYFKGKSSIKKRLNLASKKLY
ncbi:MAG: hypothetical protein IJ476_07365 [Bacteroidales bacterium]|nr:hypothetical protein [Bacteroidales bacterium]